MKTTLELPDALYHAAKTQAAARKIKMKDLLARGLEAVLAAEAPTAADSDAARRQTLLALDEILRCPPPPKGRTKELQRRVRTLRSDGWSRP